MRRYLFRFRSGRPQKWSLFCHFWSVFLDPFVPRQNSFFTVFWQNTTTILRNPLASIDQNENMHFKNTKQHDFHSGFCEFHNIFTFFIDPDLSTFHIEYTYYYMLQRSAYTKIRFSLGFLWFFRIFMDLLNFQDPGIFENDHFWKKRALRLHSP